MDRLLAVALTLTLVLGSLTHSHAEPTSTPRIQYQGLVSLNKVLWDISGATGIQFQLPESMTDVKAYVHVDADNWRSAVKQLLEEFSTMEIWTADLNTSKIWILKNKSDGSNGTQTAQATRRTIKRAVHRPKKPVVRQSKPKAPRVRTVVAPARIVYQDAGQDPSAPEKDDPLAMLPSYVKHDPEVLRYLHSNGVELPEDVKEKYGDQLGRLPPQRPMPPHIRKNPVFVRYLKSLGLQPPT